MAAEIGPGGHLPEAPVHEFVCTYRFGPTESFRGIDFTIEHHGGYRFVFKDDMVWVTFQAPSTEWDDRRAFIERYIEFVSGLLTMQLMYAFDIEPIQWTERQVVEPGHVNYVLGRMNRTEPVTRIDAPGVTNQELRRSFGYLVFAELAPELRLAVLDYRLAHLFPREAVVFVARTLEWIERYFKANAPADGRKATGRDRMRWALKLRKRQLDTFHRIANETTIARHAVGHPRRPTLGEQRYCLVLVSDVLDRFTLYLWSRHRNALANIFEFPQEMDLDAEFEQRNAARNPEDLLEGEPGDP